MADNLKKSEAELNSLLAVYWRLRHETGIFTHPYDAELGLI
jgi:hypothetical protein